MELLYISKLCSHKKFDELFVSSHIKLQQQAQKFHHLLASGLSEHADIKVTAMSGLPLSRVINKKIWWRGLSETVNGLHFIYLPYLNMAIIGHIFSFFITFFATVKWCLANQKRERYIICDVLNLTMSIAAKAAAKLFGVKTAAIVTDIPIFMQGYVKQEKTGIKSLIVGFYTALCTYFVKQYDAYVVLTEQMNDLVNPKNNPHIVIEGMASYEMKEVSNLSEGKYQEKVVVYAGALHEKYGIKRLIEAFTSLPMDDIRLWIYGSGEMEKEIREYEGQDSRIKYFGVVHNSIVIREEIKASLLVNPRPSDEEFTKYSFPSKNMEYMSTGTPLLTTKLPGMPEEYYDFVYLFDDESVEGMARTLERVLSLPKAELHAKGNAAKEFVLREKNNVVQAKKLLNLFEDQILLNNNEK